MAVLFWYNQINMAVLFWYLVKSYNSVCYSTAQIFLAINISTVAHWTTQLTILPPWSTALGAICQVYAGERRSSPNAAGAYLR